MKKPTPRKLQPGKAGNTSKPAAKKAAGFSAKEAPVPVPPPLLMNNKEMFMVAVRTGLGFTKSCQMTGNDPEQVTRLTVQDPAFLEEIRRNATNAGIMALVEQQQDLKKKTTVAIAEIRQLVFWGDYRKPGQALDIDTFLRAFLAVKVPEETATGLALTWGDYVDYVTSTASLQGLVAKYTEVKLV